MSVVEEFEKHAEKYDSERRDLIPCFDDFYGVAIEILDFNGDAPKVLDLGAGTGILTKFLLEKYPKAEVTLVDLSENMLNIAQKRFDGNCNINYLKSDFLKAEFNTKFDIVMSSLAIHHLTSDEKQKLYKKYIDLLNDGGIIVNADLVLDNDLNVETVFFQKTDDLVLKKISKDAFEKANVRRQYDKQDTIDFQLECFKNAGCNIVGVPYKFYNYAVLWGKK